jgi:hypothetical protein
MSKPIGGGDYFNLTILIAGSNCRNNNNNNNNNNDNNRSNLYSESKHIKSSVVVERSPKKDNTKNNNLGV